MAVFLAVFTITLLTYGLLWSRLGRRDAAVALRRLAARTAPRREPRRSKSVLINVAGELRRHIATRLLQRLRLMTAVEQLLERAALKWGGAGFLHRSVAFFLAGFAAVTLATANHAPLLALGIAAACALLPLWYVRRKAGKRLGAFEGQFPDALEFISRAMRAGHAFSVSLEIVQREFSEPLSGEFRRAFEEQNLGQPLEIVLRKLTQRMPSLDVQFFVSAVLLQKRTGGNLAELLDKLAYLIRERFKLRARIRAVSAQGLMSGRILSAIPLGVAALMFLMNPQYARFFIDDPMGHRLLAVGLGLQFVGYLIIRKIVNIEV